MPEPTRNDILIGFFFVIAGLIELLCDKWAFETCVEGLPIMKAHHFNHLFFVWTLQQILLACLLPLWKAIDSNFLGMGRFRHAEFDAADRRHAPARNNAILQANDHQNEDRRNGEPPTANAHENDINAQPINGNVMNENDNDQQPLIGGNQLHAVNHPRAFRRRVKKYNKLLFFPPAFFNHAHIILIYFGMRLTYSSSVVMLIGTEPVFVFLLALAFLAQQIAVFMWIGVIIVAVGLAISGLSNYIHTVPPGYEAYGIAAGDLLYTMGQITLATQMIYEEKFIRKLSIHPMKFLGAEGVFSMVFSIICLIIFNCVDTVQYTQLPNYRIEDVMDAFAQLGNSWRLILALLGTLSGYVVKMYLGILIIKEHGAMTCSMIYMLVFALYWAICLGLKWEDFYITQVPGLVMVPIGLLIYSHILVFPCLHGNDVAGEIGPNEFFMNDDEIEEPRNEEMDVMPPDHVPQDVHGAGGQNGGFDQPLEDKMDRKPENANGREGPPDDANGDVNLIHDGARVPGPLRADDPMLHA